MANTYPFPAAGPVGIGTTAPQAPLHVLSGSGLLAWFQQDPNVAGRGYIALTSSNANNTWWVAAQDSVGGASSNGLAFIEDTGPSPSPTARVYFQQGGNVGIGIMNNGARFAVAGATPTNLVQLQGQAIVPAGSAALAIGYGDNYDSTAMGDAGYIQAEHQGLGFQPVHLNPMAGSVQIGFLQSQYYANLGLPPYRPSDDLAGVPVSRFRVNQWLVASGSTENVMASFVQNTVANYPADSSAGSFYISVSGGVAGGLGTAGARALEAQATRLVGAGAGTTRALEIGLHSQIAGDQSNQNLGLYIKSGHLGWLASGVRNDSAIYVTGEDGWYNAFTYMDTSNTLKFQIGMSGNIYAAGGLFTADGSGNLTTYGTISAVLSGTTYLFKVDSTGHAYATSFTTWPSSREFKEDIAPLSGETAAELLDGLNPVRFRFKHIDDYEHMGFILEDTPPPLAPTGKGVSLMELIAVLTRVAKDQHAQIERQRETTRELRVRLEELKRARRAPGGRADGPPQ